MFARIEDGVCSVFLKQDSDLWFSSAFGSPWRRPRSSVKRVFDWFWFWQQEPISALDFRRMIDAVLIILRWLGGLLGGRVPSVWLTPSAQAWSGAWRPDGRPWRLPGIGWMKVGPVLARIGGPAGYVYCPAAISPVPRGGGMGIARRSVSIFSCRGSAGPRLSAPSYRNPRAAGGYWPAE
jgi:hypothetical protein